MAFDLVVVLIVAGNRRQSGSEVGLATESDIVFVHLAAPQLDEIANLGDSVGLLEGLDFIRQQAAGRKAGRSVLARVPVVGATWKTTSAEGG